MNKIKNKIVLAVMIVLLVAAWAAPVKAGIDWININLFSYQTAYITCQTGNIVVDYLPWNAVTVHCLEDNNILPVAPPVVITRK